MMYGREKSDSAIAGKKLANKAGFPVAEQVEPRAGTEGERGTVGTVAMRAGARCRHEPVTSKSTRPQKALDQARLRQDVSPCLHQALAGCAILNVGMLTGVATSTLLRPVPTHGSRYLS
jgi:hypothetical protein